MPGLNYGAVNKYWHNARPSILGPYVMDGFGFPAVAGRFRFQAETRIAQQLIRGLNPAGTVLDLGSGIGFWTKHFAQRFAKVVAVEASTPLYEALVQRCAEYSNVEAVQGDAVSFEPEDSIELVFLGGLLMYLNENDAILLLRKLVGSLAPCGVILCRETTVRRADITREGDYQAIYRSVASYTRIFKKCGLSVVEAKRNTPYVLIQMGCEFVKKWKSVVPVSLQMIPVVGCTVYWGLRIGYPWIIHVPRVLGLAYPELTNHFFLLRPDAVVPPRGNEAGSAAR